MKQLNSLVTFLLELVMVVSFAYYGYHKEYSKTGQIFLMLLFPLVAIALWAWFAAPRSRHQLSTPLLQLFRAVMFLIAAFFLYQSGCFIVACIVAALAIVTQMISYFAKE